MIGDPNEKLNWNSLQSGKCPRCRKQLGQVKAGDPLFCPDKNCGFFISEKKCQTIIQGMH